MRQFLNRFRRDEGGIVAIELLLVVPILVWALLSTFVYFDAFRVQSNVNRASLTVADMFSRETDDITGAYLNGARELLRELTFEEANPDYRVTAFFYREAQDDYRRRWSRNRGFAPSLTNDDLERVRDRLPIMANGARGILLETRVEYDAPFRIGIGPFTDTNLEDLTFTTFTVIMPREGQLCWLRNDGSSNC